MTDTPTSREELIALIMRRPQLGGAMELLEWLESHNVRLVPVGATMHMRHKSGHVLSDDAYSDLLSASPFAPPEKET